MFYRRVYNYPGWDTQNRFEQLERMRRQLNHFFEAAPDAERGVQASGVFPQINLTEDADRFFIRAELPGVSADEVELQATAKNLTIAGERKIDSEDEGVRYHRREREAGKFSRIIALPTEIDSKRIEANLKDGILTIRIPKAEAVKPRQISIN